MTISLIQLAGELDDPTIAHQAKLGFSINASGTGLDIAFDGYGDHDSENGFGAPIYIEYYAGALRLLVFADINQESPTHVIDLSGALESARKEEDESQSRDGA